MIICVVGPTGVGKTKLSEVLSEQYDGIVVNADAMQVYRELNIGTAKITSDEMGSSPHCLFDIKNPDEDYSVYDYQKDLRSIIEKNKDKNIIIVGGTGLYIKAGLFNYEFSEIKNKNEYSDYSNKELYALIKEKGLNDEVHINNRKRMISKLNSSKNNNLKDELLYDDVHFVGLTTSREVLYQKINDRVDKMMELGLLNEVKMLYKKYGECKSLNTGIGYKELIKYINGDMELNDAINLIKQRSRKYAKRQYTWFKNQMNVTWFTVDYDNFNNTINDVISYLENN